MPRRNTTPWEFTKFMPELGYSGEGSPGVDYSNSLADGPSIGSRQVTPTPRPQGGGREMYENRFGVFQNTPSATIFPSGPDYAGFRGDEFYSGDFERGTSGSAALSPGLAGGANAAVEYPSSGGRSPMLDDPGSDWMGRDGEPTVRTPTATPGFESAGVLDTEPSLFPSATNPFDEWWRTTTDAPSVTVNAGDGGGIWSGEAMSPPSVALGTDLNASLSDLGFGQGYPAVEPESPDILGTPFSSTAEGTGIPVEPNPLNQEVGDLTWQTSPDDRRYLPGNEPTTETSANRGGDISSFGTFGSPLTLGQFLNTSLQSMNFGGGYPPVGAGQLDINDQSGATTNWNSVRQQWERYNPATQEFEAVGGRQPPSDYPAPGTEDWSSNAGPRPPAPEDDGTGTSIIHRDEPIDLNVDFTDTRLANTSNTGTPSYGLPGQYGSPWNVPATARNMGGVNDRTGQSFQSQESAALMNAVTGWGFSAPYRTSPDMPGSFSIGGMRLDSEGGFEQVGFGRVGSDRRLQSAATHARAQRLTTAQGRAGGG